MAGRRAREVYRTEQWKRLRIDVLNAAGWRCSKCGSFADEVHHKQPLSEGGAPFDPANLLTICRPCHLMRHRVDGRPGERRVSPARQAWRRRISSTS